MKVYFLRESSRSARTSILHGAFASRKLARHEVERLVGEDTTGRWKRCPHATRRYEDGQTQFFVTAYKLVKD